MDIVPFYLAWYTMRMHMIDIGLLQIIVILVALPILAFEICMFIDMLKNKHLTERDKIIWFIAMFLVHPFVAIYYYFTARNKAR